MIPEQYPTPWELTAARSWIADCGFAGPDDLPLEIDDLDDDEIALGISWHYDGGWDAFRADFDEADPYVGHFQKEDGTCSCGWTFSREHLLRVQKRVVAAKAEDRVPVSWMTEGQKQTVPFPKNFTVADVVGAPDGPPVATIEKPAEPAMRELNFRTAHGLDVWLLLSAEGKTYVRIHDRGRGDLPRSFEVSAPDAARAFEHPYSYLPLS